jgi:glutathione gamma-glutamylcysteinyltransferase
MSGFFPLIAQFQTQAEPAYCGLASLSVALNALSIDPGRSWKGPWRWFDEALLDCCEPLERIKREGIVFGKLVCLARCNGAAVKSVLASHGSENEFREDVRRASGEGGRNVIVGYSRRAFRQVRNVGEGVPCEVVRTKSRNVEIAKFFPHFLSS